MVEHEIERRRTLGWVALPPDLGPRILSGLVLATVAIAVDYAGSIPFALMVLALAWVMSWEWGRLVRGRGIDAALVVHAGVVTIAGLATVMGYAALGLVALVVGAIAVIPLRFGTGSAMSAAGVLYVGIPVVALLWIRGNEPYGAVAILLIYAIVWSSDTGAYVTGRSIGGAKLWPRISPNKTWAGLGGAVFAAAGAAAFFAPFVSGASAVHLAILGAILGLVSQAGDLTESALKRACGVKDASRLIPGHGGVMDRLDGFVFAVTIAAIAAMAIDVYAPARALLFW